MWMQTDVQKNFKSRLKSYKPDIIVNLCTKGNHEKDLLAPERTKTVINKKYLDSIDDKQTLVEGRNNTTLQLEVQKVIDSYCETATHNEKKEGLILFNGAHPSSWYSIKNRHIELYKLNEVS